MTNEDLKIIEDKQKEQRVLGRIEGLCVGMIICGLAVLLLTLPLWM